MRNRKAISRKRRTTKVGFAQERLHPKHGLGRALRVASVAILGLGVAFGVAEERDAAAGPTAQDIMGKVAVSRKLEGSEAVVKMKVGNGKGQTRESRLSMATKLYDSGNTEKRVYKFTSPPEVKGTGVLVFDYDDKSDDVWVYLPALRKTRRIVSSDRAKSFMGSEFSYGDLNIPSLAEFNFTLVKEENVGGETCYVIDLIPKSDAIKDSEGYSKKTYWISKSKYVVLKGLYYDLEGRLLKELTASDIKLLDADRQRYRAMRMEMKNEQNGRLSVFETEKVSFAPETKDDYFTLANLEK